jgi:hypothetical protein
MADSREDEEIRRMVADFNAAVEELRLEGVPAYPPRGGRTPWAEAPETEKLQEIVWLSMIVWRGERSLDATSPHFIGLPGTAALEAIERNIDYAGLPAVPREMLQELRAGLDSGRMGGTPADQSDAIHIGVAEAFGVIDFDQRVEAAKESVHGPWPAARRATTYATSSTWRRWRGRPWITSSR